MYSVSDRVVLFTNNTQSNMDFEETLILDFLQAVGISYEVKRMRQSMVLDCKIKR